MPRDGHVSVFFGLGPRGDITESMLRERIEEICPVTDFRMRERFAFVDCSAANAEAIVRRLNGMKFNSSTLTCQISKRDDPARRRGGDRDRDVRRRDDSRDRRDRRRDDSRDHRRRRDDSRDRRDVRRRRDDSRDHRRRRDDSRDRRDVRRRDDSRDRRRRRDDSRDRRRDDSRDKRRRREEEEDAKRRATTPVEEDEDEHPTTTTTHTTTVTDVHHMTTVTDADEGAVDVTASYAPAPVDAVDDNNNYSNDGQQNEAGSPAGSRSASPASKLSDAEEQQ